MNRMEPREDEVGVVVLRVHKKNDIRKKYIQYKEAYELWRERNPVTRINIDGKLLLNLKNYILTAERITTVAIDEIEGKY